MSNRYMFQFRYSLERDLCDLYAQVTIGSTGAPTLVSASSKGIASIARNSAGKYTVTLSDKYNSLLDMDVLFKSTTGIPAAADVGMISADVSGAKTVVFQCSAAGVATDPASGATMFIHLALRNNG